MKKCGLDAEKETKIVSAWRQFETLFVQQFRLDKMAFEALCQELPQKTSLKGTHEIPLKLKVWCTALSLLATGSYQRIVGITQYLAQRTASRCIMQVVDALKHPANMEKWIVFPKHDKTEYL